MKIFLMLCVMILSPCVCYAISPETPYLGNNVVPCNVTVSSYTTSAVISSHTYTLSANLGDAVIQNNGSYDVYIATFQFSTVHVISTASNVFKLLAGQSISLGGKIRQGLFARTQETTSNTSRLDIFYVYQD